MFPFQLTGDDPLFLNLVDLDVMPPPPVLKSLRTLFQKSGPLSLQRSPAASELFYRFPDLQFSLEQISNDVFLTHIVGIVA